MTRKPVVHVLCGFIGAGKTTFARKLEAETGAVRITKDEWLIRLIGNDPAIAGFAELDHKICELSRDFAFQLVGKGVDVILDEGFWAREERDELRRRIDASGAEGRLYYLHTPIETIRTRVAARNVHPTKDSFRISSDMLDSYLEYWQPPAEDEDMILISEVEKSSQPCEVTDSIVRTSACTRPEKGNRHMPLVGEYEPSPSAWARKQAEEFEASGGAQANTLRGMPIIVLTTVGARSGKLRKTPLMRVEHEGEYAVVASLGGAPEHPVWFYNIRKNPHVELQDGPVKKGYLAREVTGDEKAIWWDRAVAAFPDYADYQAKTERQIPVFVLTPVDDQDQ